MFLFVRQKNEENVLVQLNENAISASLCNAQTPQDFCQFFVSQNSIEMNIYWLITEWRPLSMDLNFSSPIEFFIKERKLYSFRIKKKGHVRLLKSDSQKKKEKRFNSLRIQFKIHKFENYFQRLSSKREVEIYNVFVSVNFCATIWFHT